MKLELAITEKDKKLLVMLAIFLIVVGFGYLGIRPAIQKISKINEQIADDKDIQEVNDRKISELPTMRIENEKLEQNITDARETYFSMMSSDEVDRYFTDLVLSYNLNSYDLDITMPDDNCALEPYIYSAKAEAATAEETDTEAAESADETDSAASDSSDGVEEDDGEVDNGIYAVTVSMKLGGEQSNMTRLVNDLSNSKQKLRVSAYSYSTRQSVNNGVDGSYTVTENRVLNMTVEIYMCED